MTDAADSKMISLKQKTKGVTLLEVLLVLVIASSLLVLMLNYTTQKSDELRRDKTVLQIQQILNAGMSFYVSNSFWPLKGATINTTNCGTWTDISKLQPPNANYIPSTFSNNPYGNTFSLTCDNSAPNGGGFFVATQANTDANAAVIAGRLPMAYRAASIATFPPPSCTNTGGKTCTYVIANVSIPGQNLNNARSVNFAAVYYSGSCVPAPVCPLNMKASILAIPASVTGIYSPPTCAGPSPATCTSKINPVSSFTAYAKGDSNGDPVYPSASAGNGPPLNCQGSATEDCLYTQSSAFTLDGTKYWRVCLSVTTDQGVVVPSSASQIQQGKIMGRIIAITRCIPSNGSEKPSGSIDVWQP